MEFVNNIKLIFVKYKYLTLVLFAFFSFPALSYGALSITNVQITGQQPWTVSFDITGIDGNADYLGIHSYDVTAGDQNWFETCSGTINNSLTGGDDSLCYIPVTGDGSYSFTFTVNSGYLVNDLYVDGADNVITNWFDAGWFDDFELSAGSPLFDGDLPAIPSGGGFEPLNINILGTTSDFIASVGGSLTNGVKTTGQSIWPMFAFVGVLLAFIIALQLLVFTHNATGTNKKGGKGKTTTTYSKLPRTGDYRAFKRGKRANKEDNINLFP